MVDETVIATVRNFVSSYYFLVSRSLPFLRLLFFSFPFSSIRIVLLLFLGITTNWG